MLSNESYLYRLILGNFFPPFSSTHLLKGGARKTEEKNRLFFLLRGSLTAWRRIVEIKTKLIRRIFALYMSFLKLFLWKM